MDTAVEAMTMEVAAEAGTQLSPKLSAPVEPTPGMHSPGRTMAEVVASTGPADTAAEAGTQRSPERPTPVEPTPGVRSPGRMIVW